MMIDKYNSQSSYRLLQSDVCHLSLRLTQCFPVIIRENSMDGVLAISVIQHLPNHYKQLEALQNLISVCKPKGRVLIYVWSYENKMMNPRFKNCQQDYLLPWKISKSVLNDQGRSIDHSCDSS